MTKNPMLSGDHFRLGTFSSNCSSGMTPTKIAERWDNSWDNNLTLGKMLDEAGIDFMLPIARWIGYGGETDFHGNVLETMTWAAGLLASTKNIAVFATIHTAANHPAVVAKQIATIDQIGHGRAGLNIVAGWNKPEYEALGLTLADDHETRYAYAQDSGRQMSISIGTAPISRPNASKAIPNPCAAPCPSSTPLAHLRAANLPPTTPISCSRPPLTSTVPRARSQTSGLRHRPRAARSRC